MALQAWSILGDAESGYILTEGDENLNCLLRDEETAKVAPCDTGYASLSLQFASKEDIALMMSPGARQEGFSPPLPRPVCSIFCDARAGFFYWMSKYFLTILFLFLIPVENPTQSSKRGNFFRNMERQGG